jgi:RNA polymerase sigma-70 factor, ECF subfamily
MAARRKRSLSEEAEGRTREFEEQVLEHVDVLYSVALRLTQNAADAQDLTQEALLRALRFHEKFQPGTHVRAWLLTILRNTFINEYRKKARRPITLSDDGRDTAGDQMADPAVGYLPEAFKERHVLELLEDDVREAVDALPEGHRATVIMADLQGLTYQEIAQRLECPVGTVMSRLHRGRRALRRALAHYQGKSGLCFASMG